MSSEEPASLPTLDADERFHDDRFRRLPPRIRLEDTIAEQETPPKPAVIVTPEDPHSADLRYPG